MVRLSGKFTLYRLEIPHQRYWRIFFFLNSRGRQRFPTATSCGTLFVWHALDITHPLLHKTRNAPHNSAVEYQHGNHSNNKLSCHLVGTLTASIQINKVTSLGHPTKKEQFEFFKGESSVVANPIPSFLKFLGKNWSLLAVFPVIIYNIFGEKPG